MIWFGIKTSTPSTAYPCDAECCQCDDGDHLGGKPLGTSVREYLEWVDGGGKTHYGCEPHGSPGWGPGLGK